MYCVFAECDFTIIQILAALTSGTTALPFVKDLALSLVSGLPRPQRHLVFDFRSLHFVLCQLWNEGCRGHVGVWLHPCSWTRALSMTPSVQVQFQTSFWPAFFYPIKFLRRDHSVFWDNLGIKYCASLHIGMQDGPSGLNHRSNQQTAPI